MSIMYLYGKKCAIDIVIPLILTLLTLVLSIYTDQQIIIVYDSLFLGTTIYLLKKNERCNKTIPFLLLILFLLTLAFHYALIESFGVPYLGGGDDEQYFKVGNQIASYWIDNGKITFDYPYLSRNPGYFYFVGLVSYLIKKTGLNPIPLTFKLINNFFAVYLYIIVYKLQNIIGGEEKKSFNLNLIYFYPAYYYYAINLLKDTITAFLFLYLIYVWIKIRFNYKQTRNNFNNNNNKVCLIITFIIFAILLFIFREPYFYIFFIAIVIYEIFQLASQVTLITLFLPVMIILFLPKAITKLNDLVSLVLSYYKVGQYHVFYQFINRGYTEGSLMLFLYTKLPAIFKPFVLPLVFLILPFPPWWGLLKLKFPLNVVSFAKSLYWFLILPYIILSFFIFAKMKKTLLKKEKTKFRILTFILTITAVGLISISNVFPVLRYRYPFEILLLAFLSGTIQRLNLAQRLNLKYILLAFLFYNFLLISYVFLKSII